MVQVRTPVPVDSNVKRLLPLASHFFVFLGSRSHLPPFSPTVTALSVPNAVSLNILFTEEKTIPRF